jgi:hypothetical protein
MATKNVPPIEREILRQIRITSLDLALKNKTNVIYSDIALNIVDKSDKKFKKIKDFNLIIEAKKIEQYIISGK